MSIIEDLQRRAKELRSSSADAGQRRTADFLDKLAGVDGKGVRSWFEKRRNQKDVPDPIERWVAELPDGGTIDFERLDAYIHQAAERRRLPCDESGVPLEIDPAAEIESVAYSAATEPSVSAWELLSSKERTRRLDRIGELAKELARLLELPDGPAWPPAFELFDAANVPHQLRLRLTSDSMAETRQALRQQALSPMLRGLASYVKLEGMRPIRGKRLGTGAAYARLLGVHVSSWFLHRYGHCPNEVVAEIVNLLTGINPPADGDAVREWRGVK
jgi:hypothetical protein